VTPAQGFFLFLESVGDSTSHKHIKDSHGVEEEGVVEGNHAGAVLYRLSVYATDHGIAQVIILGDSGVGKTSLMNQYVRRSPHILTPQTGPF